MRLDDIAMLCAVSMGQVASRSTNTPQTILGSKLVAFVDAENNTQITQSGGLVSAYADIINAASYAQATGTAQPAVTTNAVTGRQVLRFDGVDDYLAIESIPTGVPTVANPCEIIFIGAQYSTSGVSDTMVSWGTASNNGARRLNKLSGAIPTVVVGAGSGAANSISGSAPGVFSGNHFARGIINGTTLQADMDGALSSTTALVPNTGTTRLRIGASTAASPGSFFTGDLSALLITNAVLTEAEINAISVWAQPRITG